VVLSIDRNKITQVLNNLISNAVKFSRPDTSVTLNIKKGSDIQINKDNNVNISTSDIIVSVSDQGQGIAREEQEQLFQIFETTSVKSTAGEKSTGLGLAIAKRIIEGHHGSIWVESEPGKGTTFLFSLPMKDGRSENERS
jgi:signal transduction histidine kinase